MNTFVCFKSKYYQTWYSSWGPAQPQPGQDYLSVVCGDCAPWDEKWVQKKHIILHISEMCVVRDLHAVYCNHCDKSLFLIKPTNQCSTCEDYINSTENPQYQILETFKEKPTQSPFERYYDEQIKCLQK